MVSLWDTSHQGSSFNTDDRHCGWMCSFLVAVVKFLAESLEGRRVLNGLHPTQGWGGMAEHLHRGGRSMLFTLHLQMLAVPQGFGERALELGFWNRGGPVDSGSTQLERAKRESKCRRTRHPTPPQASDHSAPAP